MRSQPEPERVRAGWLLLECIGAFAAIPVRLLVHGSPLVDTVTCLARWGGKGGA